MFLGQHAYAGDERVHGGIGAHFGRIEDQLVAPNESRVNTLLDNRLEEAPEDRQAQPGTNPAERGMVRQRFVEVVARGPAHRQVVADLLHELPLGAETGEEDQQLSAEEDFGIDRGASAAGVAVSGKIADEGVGEHPVEMAIETIVRDHGVERDEDRAVEITGLGRTEHGTPPSGRIEGGILCPCTPIINRQFSYEKNREINRSNRITGYGDVVRIMPSSSPYFEPIPTAIQGKIGVSGASKRS